MKRFADLFSELDASTSTLAKLDALQRYLRDADPADAAWAVYLLAGGKPRQVVGSRVLREFALAATRMPEWLFEESYQAVGDLAETIALLLPPPVRATEASLASWIEERLLPLRGRPVVEVIAALARHAEELDTVERFLLLKVLSGGFRVGVSRLLVVRALADVAGLDPKLVAQRMIGYTDAASLPAPSRYLALIAGDHVPITDGRPYPFYLAHALSLPPDRFGAELGSHENWLIEWKFDGIRAQLVKRAGAIWLWSRGEELVTDRFPDVVDRLRDLPDGTVLDGEIVVWREGAPQPFAMLQKRIGRKNLSRQILEDAPAAFIAYDLLEHGGHNLRPLPQRERRAALESLSQQQSLLLSPRVEADSWASLAALHRRSRDRRVEGFMLKHVDATYKAGRIKDAHANWWKWKIDPLAVDAVLVYAQRGHGRRASLYTDYTFALWTDAQGTPERGLVPFTKAYSGLTDEEMREVDSVIRRTTVEKFGPVRSVTPTMVFEIGFEGIARSSRHKSGYAVRFPRMLRWRRDKTVDEADTIGTLRSLTAVEAS